MAKRNTAVTPLLGQVCINSIANALEVQQSCIKPSIYTSMATFMAHWQI